MAPRQAAMPVNNFRAGRRSRISLLAIHTTEGARTMGALVAFQRRMGNSSYHAGSDDELIGYMVNRANEAWHLRNGNPMADGFVLCGMAGWSEAEWFRHPVMLENLAWWIASAARERGLPLRWMTLDQVRDAVRNPGRAAGGVCMHWDYTRAMNDGSHWDCGLHLPKDWIINRARQIQGGQIDNGLPTTPVIAPRRTLAEDQEMYIVTPDASGDDKTKWPVQRISFGFDPTGGWGGRAVVNLHFGFPGGWVHEAKWWVRGGTGVGEINKPHSPVPIDIGKGGFGQERNGGMGWQLGPPERADELEILLSAPGGVHLFPVYEK